MARRGTGSLPTGRLSSTGAADTLIPVAGGLATMTDPDAGARAAIVLAGGRSSRFGDGDKLTADVAGTPMLARTVGRVARAVDGVVVSCREDQVPPLRAVLAAHRDRVALVPDPVPDRGPVAGLAAAARAVRAPYVAVVAGDNPLVDPAFLAFLFDRVEGATGAVPSLDGWPTATQAVFRTDALAAASRTVLERGDASLRALIEAVDPVVVPEAEVLARTDRVGFTDVNSTADLAAAERALDAAGVG